MFTEAGDLEEKELGVLDMNKADVKLLLALFKE